MTFEEFRKVVAPLAVQKRVVNDAPTWRIYHAALVAPPAPALEILKRGAVRAGATRKWFPEPSELREDCETERQALLKSYPFEPCEKCHHTGWRDVHKDGVRFAKRCSCHAAYVVKMARLGCGDTKLVQPSPLGEPDPENYRV